MKSKLLIKQSLIAAYLFMQKNKSEHSKMLNA